MKNDKVPKSMNDVKVPKSWESYAEEMRKAGSAGSTRVLVRAEELRKTCKALLCGLGVPDEDADLTADVFVSSDSLGEESHGVRLLLHVLGRVKAGGDRAKAEVRVVTERAAVAVWDAQRSLGQVVAARAMREAIAKAREYGVGIVGVRNANSYTSAKYYTLIAAKEGMIGINYCNSGVQLVVPHGGRTPITGNNPLSIAAPCDKEFPFVLDMACSVSAMEKVFQAQEQGEQIPLGWAIDRDGNETTDPEKALASRAILGIGGYKGFGLALAHEVLTCVLMGGPLFGGGATAFIPYEAPMNISQYFQAINIEWFTPLNEFRQRMDELVRQVKSSKLRPGFDRVYLPGERGFLEQEVRLKNGIPVTERVFNALRQWAEELSVPPLEYIKKIG